MSNKPRNFRQEAIARERAKRFADETPPPICKQFGCGKKLSPTEYLFSEYCFKHAREKNQETQSKINLL